LLAGVSGNEVILLLFVYSADLASMSFVCAKRHLVLTVPCAPVNEKGAICLSILFKDCSWDNGWSPALSITSVLLSIMVLLSEPNTGRGWRERLRGQGVAVVCLHYPW
jgi:hypothetical protein